MVTNNRMTHMKSKRGQILILTLMVMAIGLIVISPMLGYLNSSLRQFTYDSQSTVAYYTVDAMMEKIINDIYRGVNIYAENLSTGYDASNFLGSGYDVSVVINNNISFPLPTPQGSSDWAYFDPGISTCNTSTCDSNYLLESLAYNYTHDFPIYIVGGNTVQVNWAMDDEGVDLWCLFYSCDPCWYKLGGSVTIKYADGSTAATTNGTADTTMLKLQLNWSVPEDATGNYTISFKNTGCYRSDGPNNCFCSGCKGNKNVPGDSGNEYRPSYSEPFIAANDSDYTWVRVGTVIGDNVYSYMDYTITATAMDQDEPVMSITATVRHNPGPQQSWKTQTVEIPSWQVTYY